jgi:hypothetical protein
VLQVGVAEAHSLSFNEDVGPVESGFGRLAYCAPFRMLNPPGDGKISGCRRTDMWGARVTDGMSLGATALLCAGSWAVWAG